ncbi:hypothetical protein [Rhizobium sp. 9140]|uniref:hypothetical protein n=1 Tax=Rhizobium sp. 9140 TaxID=1761900 RepID=UPI00079A33D2|nr:hypothetical protein [Rhizobium sp. 9140]CZT38071.1 hypothetical protein GA0004734_00049460 [Rhizobium sp. 9140]
MGLAMFAIKTPKQIRKSVDFKDRQGEYFHVWHKHPDLHTWIEELYLEKGGAHLFNKVNVRLTLDDLDRLERAIEEKLLPKTVIFTFGISDGSEMEDDLEFVAKARTAIHEGYSVYCQSNW